MNACVYKNGFLEKVRYELRVEGLLRFEWFSEVREDILVKSANGYECGLFLGQGNLLAFNWKYILSVLANEMVK